MTEYILWAILIFVALDWYEHSVILIGYRKTARKWRARRGQWWKNVKARARRRFARAAERE